MAICVRVNIKQKHPATKRSPYSICLPFSPILPARAIYATLCLLHTKKRLVLTSAHWKKKSPSSYYQGGSLPSAHLFTNPLPAEFALDGVLNDSVSGDAGIDIGDDVQRKADTYEIEHFVDESPKQAPRYVRTFLCTLSLQ